MQPENLKFGGGTTTGYMHPLVLVALLLASVLVLILPKKYVVVPLLLISFFVPLGQQVMVGGVHVLVLRIITLVALIRALASTIFARTRFFVGGFNSLDKVYFLWTLFHVVTFLVLFAFHPQAIVNQVAFVWDVLGGFLALRFFVRDEQDIDRVIRTFALIAAVLAIAMLNEHFRYENVFGYLGGDMRIVPEFRDGVARAQATFGHPLLAGTFGATVLPLFFLYWRRGNSMAVAAIGILGATIMTVLAWSSTPILAYVAGIGAICLWPFRKQMRLFRWGIVIVLVSMHIVMKAPVWFVISHISLFGSSSSDHRAYLVDLFIRHFSDWWLVGTNAAGTWGWDMWDTSNQYVSEGESGGLASFICFIAIIAICFRRVGRARKAVEGDRPREWYFWLLGATIVSHVVGFFGISYFDQTRMSWFALLVMVVAATAPVLTAAEKKEPQPVGEMFSTFPASPPRPWLGEPARKGLVGQPTTELKPRRS